MEIGLPSKANSCWEQGDVTSSWHWMQPISWTSSSAKPGGCKSQGDSYWCIPWGVCREGERVNAEGCTSQAPLAGTSQAPATAIKPACSSHGEVESFADDWNEVQVLSADAAGRNGAAQIVTIAMLGSPATAVNPIRSTCTLPYAPLVGTHDCLG